MLKRADALSKDDFALRRSRYDAMSILTAIECETFLEQARAAR
jgi:hypothetical protein